MTILEKHYSKCSVFAFGFENALKQSRHGSIAWWMKLCWLLTTFQSDAASAHWHRSLVSDKRSCVSVSVIGVSRLCCTDFHAARSENEWCILLWCLAAQTVAARHLSSCWRLLLSCARALSCYDRRLRTSHQTWPPNRPDLSSVDYRLFTVIRECIYQKQKGASNIVDELRLLTE